MTFPIRHPHRPRERPVPELVGLYLADRLAERLAVPGLAVIEQLLGEMRPPVVEPAERSLGRLQQLLLGLCLRSVNLTCLFTHSVIFRWAALLTPI